MPRYTPLPWSFLSSPVKTTPLNIHMLNLKSPNWNPDTHLNHPPNHDFGLQEPFMFQGLFKHNLSRNSLSFHFSENPTGTIHLHTEAVTEVGEPGQSLSGFANGECLKLNHGFTGSLDPVEKDLDVPGSW